MFRDTESHKLSGLLVGIATLLVLLTGGSAASVASDSEGFIYGKVTTERGTSKQPN